MGKASTILIAVEIVGSGASSFAAVKVVADELCFTQFSLMVKTNVNQTGKSDPHQYIYMLRWSVYPSSIPHRISLIAADIVEESARPFC